MYTRMHVYHNCSYVYFTHADACSIGHGSYSYRYICIMADTRLAPICIVIMIYYMCTIERML